MSKWIPPQSISQINDRIKNILHLIRHYQNHLDSKISLDSLFEFQFILKNIHCELDGSSCEAPLVLLIYTSMMNHQCGFSRLSLKQDSIITAAVDPKGKLTQVDEHSLKDKIYTVFFSPIKRLIVSPGNLSAASKILDELRNKYPNRDLIVESADHIG